MVVPLLLVAAAAAPAPILSGFVPKGRYGHCTFIVGDKLYALGGAPYNTSGLSDELLVFDPSSGT